MLANIQGFLLSTCFSPKLQPMSFKSDANHSLCHLFLSDRWEQQLETLPRMDKTWRCPMLRKATQNFKAN